MIVASMSTHVFRPGLDSRGHRKVILDLAVPAIVNQISITMLQVVDMIFIGRIGPVAIAAVGLVHVVIWTIITFSDGFATGLTACVARMAGAKDRDNLVLFLRSGLIAVTAAAVLVVPVLHLVRVPIFSLLRMPPELFGPADDYFTWFMLFLPFVYYRNALDAGFRGAGDTRSPMVIGFAINGINIVLDWLLIFGNLGFPELGVQGAALASGLSVAIGAVVQTAVMLRKPWNPFVRGPLISRSHIVRIVRIAIPATGEYVTMSLSQLMIMAVAVNPLGALSVASFQIVMRLASLSFMPGFGFAIAASALTGQYLGAGDPDTAEHLTWKTTLYCVVVMLAISAAYFLAPVPLIRLFTDDAGVIALSIWPLRVYALTAVWLAPTMVFGGSLRGAGDTTYTFVTMIVTRVFIRLVLSYLLGITFGFGLPGIWLASSSDFFIRGILLGIRVKKGRWRKLVV